MKVLNFGSCNIDYVYSLNHILKLGETQAAEKLEIFPGGKGLNQSIAVAKAGGKIYHACCFGKGGKMLKDELEINLPEYLNGIIEELKFKFLPLSYMLRLMPELNIDCNSTFNTQNFIYFQTKISLKTNLFLIFSSILQTLTIGRK